MNNEDGQTRGLAPPQNWRDKAVKSFSVPHKLIESPKGFHWILGAGHGALQPGKRSPMWSNGTQLFEWQFTRHIVRLIASALKRNDVEHTVLVPENEVGSFLSERVARVKTIESNKPLAWVSVHGNAANNSTATGIETWYKRNDNNSRILGSEFQRQLIDTIGWIDRGIRQHGKPSEEFYIFKHAPKGIPVILTENGFYTNFEQCQAMLQRNVIQAIADAHVQAIRAINQGGLTSIAPYQIDTKVS